MSEERRPLIVRQDTRVDQRTKKTKNFACASILCTETLERIAFYGVTGNLVLFLNKNPFEWMSYNATNALFVFMGLCYVLCIFFGWIADSFLGRFKTIFIFFFVYIGGYIILPLLYPYPNPDDPGSLQLPSMCGKLASTNYTPLPTAAPAKQINWTDIDVNNGASRVSPSDEPCAAFVYLSLVLMSIGTAAFKTNIAPFGGDQVKSDGPQAKRAFFNWFYWSVNIGSFIALGPIAFLQQQYSFFWGYLIPNICLLLSLIVFCCGCKFYVFKPPSGSVISAICGVIAEACNMKRKRSSSKKRQIFRTIDTAGSAQDVKPKTFLDYAKSRHGGSYHDNEVEEVKTLGKTMLLFLTMIPYWMGYYQMETTFLMQGLHMSLNPNPNPNDQSTEVIHGNKTNPASIVQQFKIPAAWLSLFDVVVVIILIPIMERVVYPRLDRANRPLLLKNRLAIGMGVAILSMLCAGLVENQRLAIFWENNTENAIPQVIGNTTYYAANMPIAWQIPQYALIGISEVFASIAGLELAYSLSPKSMQGLIMGIFYFISGIGSFLGTAVMYIFQDIWFFTWDHGDINCRLSGHRECRLDYYFFVLAGIEGLGLILYLVLTWRFKLGYDPMRKKFSSESSINPVSPSTLRDLPDHEVQENGALHSRSLQGECSLDSTT